MAKTKENEKLRTRLDQWQQKFADAKSAFSAENSKMDRREKLYSGDDYVTPVTSNDKGRKTPHVRNICAELIESQVDSNLPSPKVQAKRKEDEHLARLIEDMLRNELDRLPFEEINDMISRTVPIQGGAGYLVEWDSTKRTHVSVGELNVTAIHPKMITPQDGVTELDEMDHFFLEIPQTKEYIKRRYGVDVSDESEENPNVRGAEASSTADMVTLCVAYYRSGDGIGLFSWVGDTVVEDIPDYQAPQRKYCAKCGERQTDDVCPMCGGKRFVSKAVEYEEITTPIQLSDGSTIGPSITQTLNPETGNLDAVVESVRIPIYKPDVFPLIMQRNVSVYGKFLGDSDIDKISTQQNTINRLSVKIIDKLIRAGSYISGPADVEIPYGVEDGKKITLKDASQKNLIDVYDMEGNINQDMGYLAQVYEEARQQVGITDSFQGRVDRTATSGEAKKIAAAQAAGRLQSKRVVKDAAFARLFETMFKFKLAYSDESRPVYSDDLRGNKQYREFNKYDFLRRDAAGEYYWVDDFLFSCDTSSSLASNREAMWQETRMNLQSGAFGDPANPRTLILFWNKMESLHYPGAAETKAYLEEELKRAEQAQAAQMQAMQAQAMREQQTQATQAMAAEVSQKQAEVRRAIPPQMIKNAERG